MFATLLGALPRPPSSGGASSEALLETVVRAQEAAGLDPVTDGGLLVDEDAVEAWRATAALTDRAVKAVLLGPFSRDRSDATADSLNRVIRELAAAGCPLVEIHEPATTRIRTDGDRARFRELQQRLLDDVTGTHLSLAITGGDASAAGVETLLAAPYASLAVDLIAGPANWDLVVRTPGDRGVVCGALPAQAGTDDGPELIVWAAGYATSTGGRGPDRVGIGTASSLAHLQWDVAVAKMQRLGEALRIAVAPSDERRAALDPRALDSRSAALGQEDARASRPPRPGREST
ncbi:MAG: hypothetical protein ACJ778_00250 [Chloroflexota bacterium]